MILITHNSYFNVYDGTDKEIFFERLGDKLFYPEKSSCLITNDEGRLVSKSLLLKGDDPISKFYNFAIQANKRQEMFLFITILSALLGERILTIILEYGTVRKWQHGICDLK